MASLDAICEFPGQWVDQRKHVVRSQIIEYFFQFVQEQHLLETVRERPKFDHTLHNLQIVIVSLPLPRMRRVLTATAWTLSFMINCIMQYANWWWYCCTLLTCKEDKSEQAVMLAYAGPCAGESKFAATYRRAPS
jgi:hypothetical protein